MYVVQGGCHCGNISYVAEFYEEPTGYVPRACNCKFCTSHGGSYASDRNGTLSIKIKNEGEVSKYRQGSRIADFIICRTCGIMTGVCYEENGHIYGSINVRSANEFKLFGESQEANLVGLSEEVRVKHWKNFWFSRVQIEYESA